MAEVQAKRGEKTEAKQTEALGVLSELLAVYGKTQVMEETCVARKLGELCGVNVGKHKGRGKLLPESAGVRETSSCCARCISQ
jgi:hypothetical protein